MKHPAPPITTDQASPPSHRARGAGIDLRRAADLWNSGDRARGWSARMVGNRWRQMEKFVWWLEHEEETDPTLAAVTAERVRRYLIYVPRAHPMGRYGSDAPNVDCPSRPSSVDTIYRTLNAFSGILREEGLLAEHPLQTVRRPPCPEIRSSRSPRSACTYNTRRSIRLRGAE